jgi:hypothetical protein
MGWLYTFTELVDLVKFKKDLVQTILKIFFNKKIVKNDVFLIFKIFIRNNIVLKLIRVNFWFWPMN